MTSLTSFLKSAGTAKVVEDSDLDFVFVDRELVPARTTATLTSRTEIGRIEFGVSDWLLANAHDQLPIIAEVKVVRQESLYALVQLLMGAAELATLSQLTRLSRHYPDRFKFPVAEGRMGDVQGPVMDLYIIVNNYNPNSGPRQEILETTSELAWQLVMQEGVSMYIRKIALPGCDIKEGQESPV
ncbi:MAG: hypothetical protein R3C05_09570 [Pirellulaceae bacterium]